MIYRFQTIKGKGFKNGRLQSGSYAVSDSSLGTKPGCTYAFKLPQDCDKGVLSFLIAFSGVGRHYKIMFDFKLNRVLVYLLRDGIGVYLHHVKIHKIQNANVELTWSELGIDVRINDKCVACAFDQELKSGQWGFFCKGTSFNVPTVNIFQDKKETLLEWICFGDGFSNGRWKNRDFISWPEIVFGSSSSYFNACVAAGNSKRILELVKQCNPRVAKNIIFAVGNDDLLEMTGYEEFIKNLHRSVSHFENVENVFICSLTPRFADLSKIEEWNANLEAEVNKQGNWKFIDIYSPLFSRASDSIHRGEFPNFVGQQLMANTIADGLNIGVNIDIDYSRNKNIWQRILQRVISKIYFITGNHIGVID